MCIHTQAPGCKQAGGQTGASRAYVAVVDFVAADSLGCATGAHPGIGCTQGDVGWRRALVDQAAALLGFTLHLLAVASQVLSADDAVAQRACSVLILLARAADDGGAALVAALIVPVADVAGVDDLLLVGGHNATTHVTLLTQICRCGNFFQS